MITFTKEQLIARINQVTAINNYRISRHPDADGLEMDNELFAIALASLEAEAVAYTDAEELRFHHATSDMWPVPLGQGMDLPLYTAPPAPTVPDKITSANAPEVFEIAAEAERLGLRGAYASYAVGWNACRAAMLQGADGNSPVVPDGWVACSERMPNIGVPVITCCGDVVQYAAYAWDGKAWQDWYEEYDKLPANTFTHWHPRPAAPQQEVK